jgi:hypothetical protein
VDQRLDAGSVIRNNVFHDNYCGAFRVNTPNTLIEGNRCAQIHTHILPPTLGRGV